MAKKNPGFGSPLVLSLILFIFSGAAYWLVYTKKPKEESLKADEKKVFVLQNKKIKTFEIAGMPIPGPSPSSPSPSIPLNVSLECVSLKDGLCKTEDNSKWELTSPLKTRADDSTVNSLLKNIGNLVSSDLIDMTGDSPDKRVALLKDYRLSDPFRKDPKTPRIRITVDDGETYTAYFGEKNPVGEGVYALLEKKSGPDETKVYIVPEWQLSVFNQKTSYFRDKKLFSLNEKEIAQFTILQSKKISGKLEVTFDEKSAKWTLNAGGKKFDGDKDAIEGFLSGVTFLNAKDYVAEKKDSVDGKKALSGMKPVFDLELKTKDSKKRLKIFGKPKNPKDVKSPLILYGTIDDQDPVFEIETFSFDKLDKSFADLRVSKLIGVTDRYSITSISAGLKGAKPFTQEIIKEPTGAWKISGNESARGRVEGLLDRLTSKIINGFGGPLPSGDTLTMTFGKSPKESTHQLLFWKKGKKLYARDLKSSTPETVELSDDFSMQLPWDERFLKDANFGAGMPSPAPMESDSHEH